MGSALSSSVRVRRFSTAVALCISASLSACGMGDVRRPAADVGNAGDTSVASQPQPSEDYEQLAAAQTPQTPLQEAPQDAEDVQPLSRAEEVPDAAVDPAAEESYGYPGAIGDPISRGQSAFAMPGSEISCRTQLKQLGVVFEEKEPIQDGGVCRIDHPLKVSGFSSGRIKLKPAATLNCQMTLAFARWVKGDLTPSTRLRYLSGVNTIHQASSYSCRTMSNQRGRSMSEHSKGNALDIAKITLNNGKAIQVQKPGLFSFRQRGLLNTVRSDACDYFTTVLGPGYDRFHGTHFHFDLMQRRNGHRACR
ncbi:MAG: extensin family protein [Phyllobacterium sp.]